tara:strand:+ start:473 stop:1756 length:1284 start_codon:yes stop_codon:yes gene_type:complete
MALLGSASEDYFPTMGTVNMPKLLRHLRNRTNQVRELTFVRDAIHQKSSKGTGATSDTLGTGTALSGPLVNFGYEENDSSDRTESGDNAYHHDSPSLTAGGLIALQTPIISRATRHERTGQRVTGECKFYIPTISQIKGESTIRTVGGSEAKLQSTLATEETTLITGIVNPFAGLHTLVEFETFDKLLDKERIVGGIGGLSGMLSSDGNTYLNDDQDDTVPPIDELRTTHEINLRMQNDKQGYQIDRCSFGFRELTGSQNVTLDDGSSITIRNSSNKNISYFEFVANMGGTDNATLRWTPLAPDGVTLSVIKTNSGDTMFHFVDLPIGGVKDGDIIAGPTTGFGDIKNMIASTTGGFDTRKMVDADNRIKKLKIVTTEGSVIFVRNLELYKAAEWRIDSIKEYRDNYQEIKAVRVRGDRMSRRRAYG